ncbi:MAG: DUF1178 family protein [Alphaproteobacteria bacterium]
MILFTLQCGRDHVFEGWFRDGATYEAQAAAGEVGCPVCGDSAVTKAPMAPRIGKGEAAAEAREAPEPPAKAPDAAVPVAAGQAKAMMDPRLREMARMRAALLALKKMVQDNCDYVGADFAAEARRIHEGEADERAIYGEATDAEAEALAEDGIEVGRIPWPGDSDA